MANDPKAAAEWAEQQADRGEPQQSDDEFVCPMTGTGTCGSGAGCTTC